MTGRYELSAPSMSRTYIKSVHRPDVTEPSTGGIKNLRGARDAFSICRREWENSIGKEAVLRELRSVMGGGVGYSLCLQLHPQ